MKFKLSFIVTLAVAILLGCATTRTNVNFFDTINSNLQRADFNAAIARIDKGRELKEYTKKDRVLYYLDKGAVLYYLGRHEESARHFSQAELDMEALFTKSISSAAASFLLNDNALPYYGEVYENLYVNILQAMNYINLEKFDDAYVEIRRVNEKLQELSDKYNEFVEKMNQSDEAEIKVKATSLKFHDDVLAHYLSFLIFRAAREYDNCRISLLKMQQAWKTHSDVYSHNMPETVKKQFQLSSSRKDFIEENERCPKLNVVAFTGQAPRKKAVGGKITTYEDAIGISSLEFPVPLPNIPFPGMKEGYHFKFAFPVLEKGRSQVSHIEVILDGQMAGRLQLLEDMGKVAIHTFETKKDIVYLKTIIRTLSKGLAAAEAKEKLRKETKANDFWGSVMDAAVDMGVDATENADLRCWRTMPKMCYIGEFNVNPGEHEIRLKFYNKQGQLLHSQHWPAYKAGNSLNLIDTVLLN